MSTELAAEKNHGTAERRGSYVTKHALVVLAWTGRAPRRRFRQLMAGFCQDVADALRSEPDMRNTGGFEERGKRTVRHGQAVTRLREWGYAST